LLNSQIISLELRYGNLSFLKGQKNEECEKCCSLLSDCTLSICYLGMRQEG
jgi:hypothetical protein